MRFFPDEYNGTKQKSAINWKHCSNVSRPENETEKYMCSFFARHINKISVTRSHTSGDLHRYIMIATPVGSETFAILS